MPAFFAAQVSLGDTNIHQLSALLAALTVPFPYNNGCQIDIQGDPGNSGSIFIGDALLTISGTSCYGRQIVWRLRKLWSSYDD